MIYVSNTGDRDLDKTARGLGGRDLDKTARGLGGTPINPVTSCAEENLTMVDDSHYPMENIMIHEFGHAIMNIGMTEEQIKDIQALYQKAYDKGMYKRDIYMMANAAEYWAEGCQSWFDATISPTALAFRNRRTTVALDSAPSTSSQAKPEDPLLPPSPSPTLQGGLPNATVPPVQEEMDRARLASTDHSAGNALLYQIFSKRRPGQMQSWSNRLPDFIRRLEEALYRTAHSKEQYMDLTTLENRLQEVARKFAGQPRPPGGPSSSAGAGGPNPSQGMGGGMGMGNRPGLSPSGGGSVGQDMLGLGMGGYGGDVSQGMRGMGGGNNPGGMGDVQAPGMPGAFGSSFDGGGISSSMLMSNGAPIMIKSGKREASFMPTPGMINSSNDGMAKFSGLMPNGSMPPQPGTSNNFMPTSSNMCGGMVPMGSNGMGGGMMPVNNNSNVSIGPGSGMVPMNSNNNLHSSGMGGGMVQNNNNMLSMNQTNSIKGGGGGGGGGMVPVRRSSAMGGGMVPVNPPTSNSANPGGMVPVNNSSNAMGGEGMLPMNNSNNGSAKGMGGGMVPVGSSGILPSSGPPSMMPLGGAHHPGPVPTSMVPLDIMSGGGPSGGSAPSNMFGSGGGGGGNGGGNAMGGNGVAKCKQDETDCQLKAQCKFGKQLWQHILHCANPNCEYPRCTSSKDLLKHHQKCQCKYPRCTSSKGLVETPPEVPVKEYVKKTKAQSTAMNNNAQGGMSAPMHVPGAGQGPPPSGSGSLPPGVGSSQLLGGNGIFNSAPQAPGRAQNHSPPPPLDPSLQEALGGAQNQKQNQNQNYGPPPPLDPSVQEMIAQQPLLTEYNLPPAGAGGRREYNLPPAGPGGGRGSKQSRSHAFVDPPPPHSMPHDFVGAAPNNTPPGMIPNPGLMMNNMLAPAAPPDQLESAPKRSKPATADPALQKMNTGTSCWKPQ
eukprot:gene23037-30232_t